MVDYPASGCGRFETINQIWPYLDDGRGAVHRGRVDRFLATVGRVGVMVASGSRRNVRQPRAVATAVSPTRYLSINHTIHGRTNDGQHRLVMRDDGNHPVAGFYRQPSSRRTPNDRHHSGNDLRGLASHQQACDGIRAVRSTQSTPV